MVSFSFLKGRIALRKITGDWQSASRETNEETIESSMSGYFRWNQESEQMTKKVEKIMACFGCTANKIG